MIFQDKTCEAVVIGAGPYGLSVAAHLKHAGIAARVFGDPMAFWRDQMPRGMLMRSPWRATHFSDPNGAWSLDAYASTHGIDPSQHLSLEKFLAYGEWFQRSAVPDVDRRTVEVLEATGKGFGLRLSDGESVYANRVVIATGLRIRNICRRRSGTFRANASATPASMPICRCFAASMWL